MFVRIYNVNFLIIKNKMIENYEELVLPVILTIVFFFLIRELICWYYKINERSRLQEDNNRLLCLLLIKNEIKVPHDLMEKYINIKQKKEAEPPTHQDTLKG